MATRPQEVSLNLANVKFFSSSKHFQIQSLKLTVWFRALKRRGGGDGEGKKKKDIQKRRGRIIRLRQRTITSYFPRYPGVINFARRRKTIDRSPEVSLDVIRGVNIDVCRSQVSAGFDHNHDPVEPVPESSKEKKKRKEEEREEESWWLLRARASSPTSPFLRFTFSTSLDVFPHPFSYPSLTFTFFCYRLHEPFEMLL